MNYLATGGFVVAVKRDMSATTGKPGWRVGITTGNRPFVTMDDGSGATRIEPNIGGAIAAGRRVMIWNFDRSGSCEVFLDGASHGTASITAHPGSLSNAQPLRFNANRSDGSTPTTYDNAIEEVRIGLGLLMPAQVTDLQETIIQGMSVHDPPLCIGYGDIAA